MDFFAMLAVHGIFIFCIFSVIFGIMLFIQELPKIWCTFIVFVLTMVCAMNKVQPTVAILIFLGNCIIVIGILKLKEKRDKKEKLKEESFREEYLAREQLKREEREEKERIRLAEEQRQKEKNEAQEQREREEREEQEKIRLAQEQREQVEREEQERIRLAEDEKVKAKGELYRKENLELDKAILSYYSEFSAVAMDDTSPYATALNNFYHMNHLVLQEIFSDVIHLEILLDSLTDKKLQTTSFEFSVRFLQSVEDISPFYLRNLVYPYEGYSSWDKDKLEYVAEDEINDEKNIDIFRIELSKFQNLLEKENFMAHCCDRDIIKLFVFFYCIGMAMEHQSIAFENSHSIPTQALETEKSDQVDAIFSCFEDKLSTPSKNKELLPCFYYCVTKGLLPRKEYGPVELYENFTDSYRKAQANYIQKAKDEQERQATAEREQQEQDYKNRLFSSTSPDIVLQPVLQGKQEEFTKEKRKSVTTAIMYEIDQMDGLEFESFVCKLFKAKGYYATVTSGSHDQGVDVIANLNGEKIGIQAKRYSSPVSNKAIQEIVGAKNLYQLSSLMVITNNQFTKSAIELGESNRVMMWNREKLQEEIFDNTHLLK